MKNTKHNSNHVVIKRNTVYLNTHSLVIDRIWLTAINKYIQNAMPYPQKNRDIIITLKKSLSYSVATDRHGFIGFFITCFLPNYISQGIPYNTLKRLASAIKKRVYAYHKKHNHSCIR